MTYSEAIRSGFGLINRRWQLVAIRVVLMVLNCLGFFVIIGIPLGIAVIIFGLDLGGFADVGSIFDRLARPADLFSRFFGIILVLVTSFLLYLLIVTTLWLYVFSGSAGIIRQAITEPSSRFTMHDFFGEARRMFFPVMWFSLLIGVLALCATFILGLMGGVAAALVQAARSQDSTLALFLGIFFTLVIVLVGISVALSILAVTMYGIAALFFRKKGAVQSFRDTASFLWRKPDAFWLYALVLAGYAAASFLLMLVVYPFNLIPLVGTVIILPFHFLSYIVQGYLGLVVLAVVFSYYYESEIRMEGTEIAPEEPSETAEEVTGESSSETDGTSEPPAPGPDALLPGSDRKEES